MGWNWKGLTRINVMQKQLVKAIQWQVRTSSNEWWSHVSVYFVDKYINGYLCFCYFTIQICEDLQVRQGKRRGKSTGWIEPGLLRLGTQPWYLTSEPLGHSNHWTVWHGIQPLLNPVFLLGDIQNGGGSILLTWRSTKPVLLREKHWGYMVWCQTVPLSYAIQKPVCFTIISNDYLSLRLSPFIHGWDCCWLLWMG